jgi:hypothetical protein
MFTASTGHPQGEQFLGKWGLGQNRLKHSVHKYEIQEQFGHEIYNEE